MKKPPMPPKLGESGKALWRQVAEEFAIDEHERLVLVRACRTLDLIDQLQAVVDREGLIAESSQGSRAHPALTEMRQQQLVLVRLLKTLRLEFGEQQAKPTTLRSVGA